MNMENKCENCGAYKGHSPFCKNQTMDDLRENLKLYYDAWEKIRNKDDVWRQEYIEQVRKSRKEAEFWKGKFNTLKLENNALRKNLNKNK